MIFKKYKLNDLIVKYDNKRKPLSTIVRNKMEKKYPYYGANGIIDYVDDYLFDDEYLLLAEDGTVLIDDLYPVLYKVNGKFWVSNHAHVFKAKEDIVLQDYLYYALKCTVIRDKITGSTQPKLNQENMGNIEINVPDISTQKKIIKILLQLDKKIEQNTKIAEKTQKFINNLFKKMFIDFSDNNQELVETDIGVAPCNFKIVSFGDIISFSNGYGWNSKDMIDVEKKDTVKVFKMGNINIGGGINKSKTKSWIPVSMVDNLEQYYTKKGDILMCMTDMKANENPLLGHTALVDTDNEFVVNQRVGIIRCNKGIDYPFVYTLTNSPGFIADIRSRSHSGVQVNLTTGGICETKLILPDEESLKKFNKFGFVAYDYIFNCNKQNEKLEKIRNVLLEQIMNGNIDIEALNI